MALAAILPPPGEAFLDACRNGPARNAGIAGVTLACRFVRKAL